MCRKSETKFVTQRNDVTLEFSRNHDSFTSFEEISKSNQFRERVQNEFRKHESSFFDFKVFVKFPKAHNGLFEKKLSSHISLYIMTEKKVRMTEVSSI